MNVIFDGRYKDRTNFTSSEYLHINSCGVSRLCFNGKPRKMNILRPDGRVDHHFFMVTDGEVSAVVGENTYLLKKGDCMFYKAGDPQEYTYFADESIPLSAALYVHFCGTAADEVIKKAGLTRSAPLYPAKAETRRVFEAMIRCDLAGDSMAACGYLLRLTSLMSPESHARENDSVRFLRAEAEYISSHYNEEIDLNLCAARCNLSRSRFTHLFTEVFGVSPARYQQRLRLEQACELLRFSSQSVGEIAESIGFMDALYFSRLFKKTVGVTPSEYRGK